MIYCLSNMCLCMVKHSLAKFISSDSVVSTLSFITVVPINFADALP